MLGDPERAEAFGREGRRSIERTYSFDRMVDQFESLYLRELDARMSEAAVPVSRTKRAVKRRAHAARTWPPACRPREHGCRYAAGAAA